MLDQVQKSQGRRLVEPGSAELGLEVQTLEVEMLVLLE